MLAGAVSDDDDCHSAGDNDKMLEWGALALHDGLSTGMINEDENNDDKEDDNKYDNKDEDEMTRKMTTKMITKMATKMTTQMTMMMTKGWRGGGRSGFARPTVTSLPSAAVFPATQAGRGGCSCACQDQKRTR